MSKSKQMIDVSVISRKKGAILVEFQSSTDRIRKVVPVEKLLLSEETPTVASVSVDDFEAGLAYGIPFEYRLRNKSLSPEDIANSLHRNGIWTAKDVRDNPKLVQNSLLEVVRSVLSDINILTKEYIQKEN